MKLLKFLEKVNLKTLGVDFIDVRIEWTQETVISFQNFELYECVQSPSLGAFVRVFHKGNWSYFSTTDLEAIEKSILDFSSTCKSKKLGSVCYLPPKKQDHFFKYATKNQDFSMVSVKDKKELVLTYVNALRSFSNMKNSIVRYGDSFKRKAYKASNGNEFEFDMTKGSVSCRGTLVDGEKSFLDKMAIYSDNFGGLKGKEQSFVDYFTEAHKFIHAPAISPGKYKVLLSPEVTGVFTHESFGHKSEADFLIADPEAAKNWVIGQSVASPVVSIVDCGLHEGTSGYVPVDDEAQHAKKNYLIKNGVLSGRLHSQETATILKEEPTGNARAKDFTFEPIVRMTSTYIEPGIETKEDLIAKCSEGLFIDGVKHGMGGSTFTIAPLRAYKITNGKITDPVKVTVISGSLFKTLNDIEAVANDFVLESSHFGGCGKMEQWPLPVADGGPTILVNEMQVG